MGDARMTDPTSVEVLPNTWGKQANTLREYGGKPPAVALEYCAAQLETAERGDSDAD